MVSAAASTVKYCPACHERFPDDGVFCPNDGSPLVATPPAVAVAPGQDGEGTDGHGSPSSRPDPYLKREILDHIEIRELVGIGAMGRVYRAFQRGIDRDVAVKVLHRELSANPQLVARFLREAKVASRLQHPNVVNVILSGQLPDGALYIVMEYLHGQSLQSALVESEGAFDLSRALHLTLQLCDAVGEAHVQGIVHRDLKPENVMLVRRGQDSDFVKVLDFGIARLNWSEQSMATATGLIFGTARYISPEGAQGEKVGPPGDVYSIATLAYQMLAGRTPFEGDQAVGLLIQQIHEQPPPLRSHASAREVPPVIADVIMRALAKDPKARPDGARALGRAFVEAARASGVAADDFYARSLFAAGSGSGKARIAPASDPALPNAAAAPHAPSKSTRDVGADVPAAGPTARWTPPAAVQAQLAAVAAERRAANVGGPNAKGATAPGVRPRSDSVDPTLDDDDVPPAPTKKTDYATPATPFGATVRLDSSPQITGPSGTLPLKNDVEPISDRLRPSPSEPRLTKPSGPDHETRAARARADSSAERSAVTEPGLNATVDDEPSRRGFTVGIVFLCFLLGVGGAVAIHRSGVIQRIGQGGTTTVLSPVDAHVARAKDAVERERWEEPPGDNVRELMTTGLGRWPNEPRLLALKAQANDALVRRAVSVRPTDLKEAVRLARLASDIAPDNATTRAIADDYARELAAVAPPLATVTPSPSITAVRPPAGAPASAAKVALDATPAKPRIGQSVQLVARVSSKSSVSDAAFFIVAVGQPQGTRLVPLMDGNTFRGAFTFLEPGRYEVSFTGKVDNAVLKSSRTLVVDSGATPAPEPQTPPPAPSGSVKWL